jgi:hypothetical protein
MLMPLIRSRAGRAIVLAATVLASTSCASELTRTGKSPSFLIIDSLAGSSGATAGTFGSQLNSDVQTLINQTVNGVQIKVPTIFNDLGQATLRVALKNPGPAANPTAPTTINEITVTRYHVKFRRSDGREREGIDVPYAFDGGVTGTVNASGTSVVFDLVRHSMKEEPPLSLLVRGGGAGEISTIAEITLYGRDQAGNEVSVMGMITVNFADFGDPS